MDLSKLPKLSETDKHAPPPASAQPPNLDYVPPARAREELVAGPEVFINVVIGLILIYMGWPIFDYLIHLTGARPFKYPVTDAAGNPMSYPHTVFFWMNIGVALFGVALVLYGLLGRSANRAISGAVLMLLALAAAVCAYATIASMSVIGLQLLPALCAAFALYLGMYQWKRFNPL
jgi:hypothetical protein